MIPYQEAARGDTDDILIASDCKEEHVSHLQIVFDRLSQHGLIVNPANCQFGMLSIDFLGRHITKDGAIPLPSKRDTPPHNRIANSLCERFHRSMKAALRASLKDDSWCEQLPWVLLGIRTTRKEDLPVFICGAGVQTATPGAWRLHPQCLRALVCIPPVLHPPEQFGMLSIDFLGRHITNDGACLYHQVHKQLVGGVWRPLAFFSRQLHPNEQKCSTFGHKLLGLYLAVCHFQFLLEGRLFMAFIDHKPLAFTMSKIAEP
ncbi:hypothetical protein AAFF_G00209340 [Aldrovandia affinis]|uniref:ribonuclease H n=1 Tax=Aldrovandia affinis TaxID=143900 RepID=A0AAD7SX37_9TELE|nr:hypothetical protein AAFF_G00209340 [Aldrovandia affinis]